MNLYQVSRVPLLRRIGWRLLPPTRHRAFELDLPEWAGDALHVETHVHLGFIDRMRVLFTGRLEVRTKTDVEHPPGRAETESSVSTA